MDARGFFARVTSDTSQQYDKPLVAISSRHAWNGILVQDNFRYSVLKILQFLGILESNEEKMGYIDIPTPLWQAWVISNFTVTRDYLLLNGYGTSTVSWPEALIFSL